MSYSNNIVCPTCRRRYRPKDWKVADGDVLSGPDKIASACLQVIARADREHFVALYLNTRHRLICQETISIGTLNASLVHPREIFKSAILHSASCVILAHNHPSGEVLPSADDIQITKRLVKAGSLLGIAVLDHLIVSGEEHFSFYRDGSGVQFAQRYDPDGDCI